MNHWSLDLGTTNVGLAHWDGESERPRMLQLDAICRQPDGADHLEAPRLIPAATHLLEPAGFWGQLGTWKLFRGRLWGEHALVGRPALDKNAGERTPAFAPSFKAALSRSPLKTLARLGPRRYSARDIARTYIRELIRQVKEATGERIREVTVTAPVDSYEGYRAEVQKALKGAGVRKVRFIDEPVAAAVGYGLAQRRSRNVLVVDFGAGTLDFALVTVTAKEMSEGRCEVIAKEGRAIGGDLVDRWLLAEFCERLDYPLDPDAEDEAARFWFDLMLTEARRVKERVFFAPSEAFYLTPPEALRSWESRVRGAANLLEVTKGEVQAILKRRGLYDALEALTRRTLATAARHNIAKADIDDVLMVGGSTLLPGVYPFFEERFGRDRVRAWQPFEAVAYGACAFAAGAMQQTDFIVHDYAFVTYHSKTHAPQYTVIVPRGTRFPAANVWKRRLVPTCSLGEPETQFKLVISEIGEAEPEERRFAWDSQGQLRKLGGAAPSSGGATDQTIVQLVDQVIVPLNEANPTLGKLSPPHLPSDRAPRLEITFGVDADRWLLADVIDLKTRKKLMTQEPVVRLL